MRSTGIARYLVLLIGIPLLGCAAGRAHAGDGGFGSFCKTWMGKLEQRERHNLNRMALRQRGAQTVGEYTGYARKAVECKPTSQVTPGKPAVGTLVYHELKYRKAGPSRAAAKQAKPTVVQRTEVMEVFRYDGRRWTY
jgi:hypothetical protein